MQRVDPRRSSLTPLPRPAPYAAVEAGLAGTNRRFLDRFSRVEAALGGDLQGKGIAELEGHWQQAKAQIRAERTAP